MMEDTQKCLASRNSKVNLPLVFILFVPCFFVLFLALDNDIWFLLNHGRYVLENGIPHIEPFTIHPDFHFVMQQWLSSVIFWLVYSDLGAIGIKVLTMLCYATTVFLMFLICKKVSKNNIFISFIITSCVTFILLFFMVSRPYIFSIPVFILELYLLESYRASLNKKYLFLLPLLSVLLINLQAAMWPMFFIIIVPYIIETFKFNIGPFCAHGVEKKWLYLFTLLALPAGLINPYGLEATTYLFKSYGLEQINIGIQEMLPVSINDSLGKLVFACIIIIVLTYCGYKKGVMRLRYILLSLGTGYMALSSYRNLSFFAICAFFPLAEYLKDFIPNVKENTNSRKTKMLRISLICLIIAILPFGFYTAHVLGEPTSDGYELLNKALDNISGDEEAVDVVLYTGFNTGNLAEFRGFRAYVDTRAEVFFKKNNGKADVFPEYFSMQQGEMYYKDVLEKYSFTHILLTKDDILYTYLPHDSDYHLAYSNDKYSLYIHSK